RLGPRRNDVIERATESGFMTGLRSVTDWMIELHGSEHFRDLHRELGAPTRRFQPTSVTLLRRAGGQFTVGLALACLTNDRPIVRARAFATFLRRASYRAVGWDPG